MVGKEYPRRNYLKKQPQPASYIIITQWACSHESEAHEPCNDSRSPERGDHQTTVSRSASCRECFFHHGQATIPGTFTKGRWLYDGRSDQQKELDEAPLRAMRAEKRRVREEEEVKDSRTNRRKVKDSKTAAKRREEQKLAAAREKREAAQAAKEAEKAAKEEAARLATNPNAPKKKEDMKKSKKAADTEKKA